MLVRLLAACLVLAAPARAEPVEIATWNIEHLRAETGIGAVKRTEADFAALRAAVLVLDADIVALQEVNGPEAAARVFPPEEYAFYFSARNNTQRTGFAVRRDLVVYQNPDLETLGLGGDLRHGADITVDLNGTAIRLLSVHLKSGCWEAPLTDGSRDCVRLVQQVPALEAWIDARSVEDVSFAVLGDFNRRFDLDEALAAPGAGLWQEIDDGDPAGLDLVRANAGRISACKGGRYPDYIDHLVLDEQAAAWIVPGSFEQVLLPTPTPQATRLSDHCPISVRIDPVIVPSEPKTEVLSSAGKVMAWVRSIAKGFGITAPKD